MQVEAAVRAAEVRANPQAVAPYGGRTVVEGVEEWMWEWREWRVVAPGEPCPGGLDVQMDFATGTNHSRLPARLRELLDAAEPAGGGDAGKQPPTPFPPQPESPPEVPAEGESEGEVDVAVEDVEEEVEYGPSDLAVALMYEDNTGPVVYAGMDMDPANAPLLPMPSAVPPPPLESLDRRHCRFHAAEDVHQHRLSSGWRREATLLVGALERYEFQPLGRVAREKGLEAVPPQGDQVYCVQLEDTAVMDHHPGEVRAVEPQENLPLAMRLAVVRLLEEAGLEGVDQESRHVAH